MWIATASIWHLPHAAKNASSHASPVFPPPFVTAGLTSFVRFPYCRAVSPRSGHRARTHRLDVLHPRGGSLLRSQVRLTGVVGLVEAEDVRRIVCDGGLGMRGPATEVVDVRALHVR
jgi:hypothetical protein